MPGLDLRGDGFGVTYPNRISPDGKPAVISGSHLECGRTLDENELPSERLARKQHQAQTAAGHQTITNEFRQILKVLHFHKMRVLMDTQGSTSIEFPAKPMYVATNMITNPSIDAACGPAFTSARHAPCLILRDLSSHTSLEKALCFE